MGNRQIGLFGQRSIPNRAEIRSTLFLVSALFFGQAHANTYSFDTLQGQETYNCSVSCGSYSSASLPVDAAISFKVSAGSMVVTVTNWEQNIVSVGQNISSLLFTVENGSSLLDMTQAKVTLSANIVNVGSGGIASPEDALKSVKVTSSATSSTHWTVDGSQTTQNQMFLNDLNGGGAPDQTIIGPPDSNGNYPYANASLEGNHNPFIQKTATFTVADAGLLSTSKIGSVYVGFGTTPDCNIMRTVPEPGALALFAIGAAGLVGARRRKIP